jgi:hypothetical protein
MSQQPPQSLQTVCCGQIRPVSEIRTVSSVNLYIGVISRLISAPGAPSFGHPDSKLPYPGDIFDILIANNILPANIYRDILNIQSLRSSLTPQNIKSSILSVVDNSVFLAEPPFFNAVALLESLNVQAESIAARKADLIAATDYLESLLSYDEENKILDFIKTTARWNVCHAIQPSDSRPQCCAGQLRNINRGRAIEVSIHIDVFILVFKIIPIY